MVSILKAVENDIESKPYKHTSHLVLKKLFNKKETLDVSIGYVGNSKEFNNKLNIGIRVDVVTDDFKAPAYVLDKTGKKIEVEDEVTGVVSDKIELHPVESFFFNFNINETNDDQFKISNSSKIAPVLLYSLKSSGDIPDDYDEDNQFGAIELTEEEIQDALLNLEMTIEAVEKTYRQPYYIMKPL
jgi:hypothetical protein